MSKHNYSQYSNKPNKNNKSGTVNPSYVPPATDPKVKMEYVEPVAPVAPIKPVAPVAPVVNMVEETVSTVTLPETVTGTVANCAKLNVRATPSTDAEIVYVLDAASEIQIDVTNSDKEWLKVCTATGIEGYCMRKFVDAHL